MKFQNSNSKSFTIIEASIAIFLITTGILAAFVLVQQTLSFYQVSSLKLIAAYLAQEGIEIVRNIRDSNWLKKVDWDEGLNEGEWEADYSQISLNPYEDRYLKIDEGFYKYSPSLSASKTPFKRKIIISNKEDLDEPPNGKVDKMTVKVEISWQERGRPHQVSVQENLYNWR
jgi:hypothetical protein